MKGMVVSLLYAGVLILRGKRRSPQFCTQGLKALIRQNKRRSPRCCTISFFINETFLASFSFIFGLFKQSILNFTTMNVKHVHPVSGAGIRTHNLLNSALSTLDLYVKIC